MPPAPRRRRFDLAVLLALGALLLVLATAVLLIIDLQERRRIEQHLRFAEVGDEAAFFEEAATYAAIRKHVLDTYVDPVDPHKFLLDALDGAVRALDPHSRLIRAEDQAAVEELARGEYHGIGVRIDGAGPALTVLYPLGGSPADLAGLRPGDRILKIDEDEVDPKEHAFAIELLTGGGRTRVMLQVSNEEEDGGRPRTVEAWRQPVAEPSVRHPRLIGATMAVGYVAIASFTPNTGTELKLAFERLQSEGALGFVIDLRQNGGGSYDAAIDCARLFIKNGVIVSERRRGLETNVQIANEAAARFADKPLALLIDRSTASASEILAGALQDHGRAVLIGERSYGKGVVQSTQRIPGVNLGVRLTTEYYFTPLGRNFESRGAGTHGGGLIPDLLVPSEDAHIARVREWIRSVDIPEHHRAAVDRYTARTGHTALDEALLTEDQLVLTALDLLEGRPPRPLQLPRRNLR